MNLTVRQIEKFYSMDLRVFRGANYYTVTKPHFKLHWIAFRDVQNLSLKKPESIFTFGLN